MRNVVLIAALSTLPLSAQATDTFQIDPSHTYANFSVLHLGYSSLYGRIHATGGSFSFDPEAGTGTVQVELDPATIDTGHEERDDHLRSPDFLNVEEFSEMTFESTSVSLDENGGTIEGELNLMGQSQPVTLEVTRWGCGEHPFTQKQTCGFDAVTVIKRSDFGMTYGLPGIGDEMTLMIGVEGSVEG